MDDDVLTKMATEELLREAKMGAERAATMGPEGWRKCPLPKTNKTFLKNTLRGIVHENKQDVKKPKTSAEPDDKNVEQ